jgi:hypothetical protein
MVALTSLAPVPAECTVCRNSTYLHLGRCVASCPGGTISRGNAVFNRRCEPIVLPEGPSALGIGVLTQLLFTISDSLQYTPSILRPLANQISLRFRTAEPEGVLIFSESSTPNVTDFVSIELVAGQVVFSFDLGSGAGSIATTSLGTRFDNNAWHNLQILRVGSFATLSIDGVAISGVAPGTSQTLEAGSLYLGAFVSSRTTARVGFVGCLQQALVDGFPLDTLHATAVTGSAAGVCLRDACDASPCVHGLCMAGGLQNATCECWPGFGGATCNRPFDACADLNPCRNGATCSPVGNASYICDCPLGFSGTNCEFGTFFSFLRSVSNSQQSRSAHLCSLGAAMSSSPRVPSPLRLCSCPSPFVRGLLAQAMALFLPWWMLLAVCCSRSRCTAGACCSMDRRLAMCRPAGS